MRGDNENVMLVTKLGYESLVEELEETKKQVKRLKKRINELETMLPKCKIIVKED